MSNDEYTVFFEEIKKFKEKQNKQKENGKNDFNILTTVRKYHDEVYLHSAMIGALLNPLGLHYRGTLFLELFLETVGLKDWKLDLKNTSVHVEYENIDLYITDGTKHIIIENKIFAKDQKCQIIRYINIIVEENEEAFKNFITDDKVIHENKLRVIYLTPSNSKEYPDEHNVNNDGYIYFSNNEKLQKCPKPNLKAYKVKYKKISYDKGGEILNWLEKSKEAVGNISNLNEALKQYIDVVEMVNKNYTGKVMQLEDRLLKNKEELQLAKEISEAYNKAFIKNKKDFFKKLKENLHLPDLKESGSSGLNLRLLIKNKSDKYNLKFQIAYEKETVLITLFKELNSIWAKSIYQDENMDKIKNLKNLNLQFIPNEYYFCIDIFKGTQYSHKLLTDDNVTSAKEKILEIIKEIEKLNLK